MKALKNALDKSIKDLLRQMTEGAQAQAVADGWNPHVAETISVGYSGTDFSITVDEKFHQQAFDEEFGTQEQPPKASLRRFGNQNTAAEAAMVKLLEKYVGEVL